MIRFAAAVLLLAAASLSRPAEAGEVRLSYEIRLGGLMAGEIELTLDLRPDGYRVEAQTRSRGLVDALVGFRSKARSEGALIPEGPQPREHRADNEWRGEPREVRITYAEDGPVASASPPAEEDDRGPVPEALMRGTLDPLTAALKAALDAQAGSPCEGRLEVFDGRRRYALEFAERAPAEGGLHCRLRLERIAGMSHDPWLPIIQPIETAELWLARLRPDLPPIPHRLQADTAFGAAIVRLTAIDGVER